MFIVYVVNQINCYCQFSFCCLSPQGERPHPSEMAGSDLDGDLYFVTWHEELILKKENESPMHFPSAEESHLDRPITEFDIIQQLKFNVESDNTGRISHQHLIFADLKGIWSEECMRLADLSAQMYDAPKTGVVPEWPKELKTHMAPDFLEKGDHRDNYKSERVLGRLHQHSKLMLENVARLSNQKCTWNRENGVHDCSNSTGTGPLIEMASLLQESYAGVMQSLSQTYGIREEIKIWRARFPGFRNTEEEGQNRTKLINNFRNVQQTMRAQYESAVRQLQQPGMKEDDCRDQLYRQCKRLITKPYCAGLTLMLNARVQSKTSEVDQTWCVYRQIGDKIIQSLKPAGKCRLLTKYYIALLIEQSKTNSFYTPVLNKYAWFLASTCFLVDHLCHQEDVFSSRKMDCILHVLLHVAIKLKTVSPLSSENVSLLSSDDIVSSKDSLGFLTTLLIRRNHFLARRLTTQLHNFLSSTDQSYFHYVGMTAVSGLWEIYTKKEESITDGYKSWEMELKSDAIDMLLRIAFRSDFDTPMQKVD